MTRLATWCVPLGLALTACWGAHESEVEPEPLAAYDACMGTSECGGELTCVGFDSNRARICTVSCAGDGECPADASGTTGHCLETASSPTRMCFQACASEGDDEACIPGYACTERDWLGALPPSCLPIDARR